MITGKYPAPKQSSRPGEKTTRKPLKHLSIVDNWIRYEERKEAGNEVQTCEFPIYTDVAVSGECTQGPYRFLNPVAPRGYPGSIKAAVILRYTDLLEFERPDLGAKKTDSSRYHGGALQDEIAALMSLLLGARFTVGALSRIFGPNHDPLGRPVAWHDVPLPQIIFANDRPVVPSALGTRNLSGLAPMHQLVSLTPEQCVALIRSARLYQDALWLCEREAALSWLMLVSALEGAANCWRQDSDPPLERLRMSKPEFVAELEALDVEGLPDRVATEFADSLGVTKKFVDFCLEHLPPAPTVRPSPAFQVDWTADSWKKKLQIIYRLRSKALHEGTPFPFSMCQAPDQVSGDKAPSERGTSGLAVHGLGGRWEAKDLPTNLNTFMGFTRDALLKWLQGMLEVSALSTAAEKPQTKI